MKAVIKTVKTLTLTFILALLATYSSAETIINEFRGKPHGCGGEKCPKCDIPEASYVLANPLTQENRYEAILFVDGPRAVLVLIDKVDIKSFLLDGMGHRKGKCHKNMMNDVTLTDNSQTGRHSHCDRRGGGFGGPGKHKPGRMHSCKDNEITLKWNKKPDTPQAMSGSLTLNYSNKVLSGKISITGNGSNIKDRPVTFMPE